MGFAAGFRAGSDVVNAAEERRLKEEERRRREELRIGLQQESARFAPTQVASGEEALRTFRENYVPAPGGPTAEEYIAQNLQGLQQRPSGYTVEQALVPEFGGRQYETLSAAEQAIAPSRTAGLANVYRQAGEIGKAEELMGLSRQAELQNLQISGAKRAEQDTIRLEAATQAISELGRPPTLEDIRNIASANKLTLDQQFKLGQNLTGIAEQDAKMLKINIQKKIKGKNLDALLKIHKDDPTFDDSSYFEKSVNKKGEITLTQKSNDGTVLGTQSFKNAEAATSYLNQAAVAPENLYTWLQTNRLNEAKLAESQANIGLARARTEALPGATAADSLRQNIALADQYRKQISDIDTQLANYGEGTPQYNALFAQRNAINRALVDVNKLLRPSGLTRSGAQPASIDVEGARAVASSGINPDTNKPFTAAEKKEYEKIFNEPFPESTPTSVSASTQGLVPQPASPRAARAAARRDTIPKPPPQTITTRGGVTRVNPDYLEWERQYGRLLGPQ
jgi:hypothetical protein